MAGNIEKRLEELGIVLPEAPTPVANYLPYVKTGNILTVAGQIPKGSDGLEFVTTLATEKDIPSGQGAARLCTINMLAQVKAALGSLDNVKQFVKIQGFVNCTPNFVNHADVINGAPDLLVQIFGDVGKHARIAVGCSSLPLGVAVELDATVESK